MKRIVVLGPALIAAMAATSAVQAETVSVGLPSAHGFYGTPFYVAEALGYLDGLDIEYMVFAGGSDVARQVSNGSADIGFAQPTEILLNALGERSQTLPISYWYMAEPYSSNQIAVPTDSDIQSLADVRGRVIGISSLTASNVAQFRIVLERNGMNPDTDVIWRAVGLGAEHLMALSNGTIDVSATNNMRHASYEFAGVPLRVVSVDDTANQFGNGLFSHNDNLADEAKRAQYVTVAQAFHKATQYCVADPEACVQILYDRFPELMSSERDDAENMAFGVSQLDARLAVLALRDDQNGVPGYFPDSVWDASIDFLASVQEFPADIDASVIYTNDIALAAAQ